MPLDKLHSEYKSTYRWHEFSAGPEVVRKPPMPNQFVINAPINEPPLPRRKKCPELAYRHHEFIIDSNADKTDSSMTRARSGDRNGTPSRRSKSEGPPLANGRCVNIVENVSDRKQITEKAGESSGLFRKTISKLSTEYRLQFVWPNAVRKVKGSEIILEPPKKSQSMGAIKSTQTNTLAGIHKKRTTNEKEATAHELEPLVIHDTVDGVATTHEKKDMQNEYRKNFKSAFYSEKEKFGFEQNASNIDNKVIANGNAYDPSWYKEVLELRKKAGEYRNRGWQGETSASRDLYNKQKELWREVSRRSSLSALSLASSIKPITKEEKERENKIKSSPTKPSRRVPGSARLIDNRTETDGNLFGRFRRDNIRHHLERTTGVADVEEGALLPSPTREKLMPTLPRSKTGSPQRGSPQKTFSGSRHGSPLKGSPQKSPKKISKVGRSQSVGPTVSDSCSPKKQPKPMSASVTASTASSAAKTHKKTPASTPTITTDHQPRSTASLSSSNKKHSRSKSSTLPNSARQKPSTFTHHSVNNNTLISSSSTPLSSTKKTLNNQNTNKAIASGRETNLTSKSKESGDSNRKVQANKTIENKNIQNKQIKLNMRPTSFNGQLITDNSMHGQRYNKKKALEMDDADLPQVLQPETIIKSPPEPTRVKSPEQIVIMRSPDPVFWTVPLDTGKTFTVTQNVRAENEANIVRPHSEIKVTTPSEPQAKMLPQEHPQSQSAPPELWEENGGSTNQSPLKGIKTEGSVSKHTGIKNDELSKNSQDKTHYDRPIPGSTLRCLEDPGINSPPSVNTSRNIINPTDEARDRFDKFWGGNVSDVKK
ncbi:hypothetical protein PVAND_003636 [Polypedilum vanderplanki]|uniref:Nuclear protein MDM1 n=1 Tax=Polypedilum vanderplanki TaxID=319348 RepID=A0A9J6BVS0_POLVA|nr:hypothetical protein PVAND_003636 [Polypedilum vanderplanki]